MSESIGVGDQVITTAPKYRPDIIGEVISCGQLDVTVTVIYDPQGYCNDSQLTLTYNGIKRYMP